MNLENIKVGQEFKNYKVFCNAIGIEAKKPGSNSRKAQIKIINTKLSYITNGQKITITEIHSEVKKKMDNRALGNNNTQAKCIRYLLCDYLSTKKIGEDEVIGFSKFKLLRKLHLINDNFISAKIEKDKYSNALNVGVEAIEECFDYLDNRTLMAVKKAINVLRQQSVLGYKYSFTWVDTEGVQTHCSTIEENIIQLEEMHVLTEMNIKVKHKVYEFGRWEEFKARVNSRIKKNHGDFFPNLKYYYSSFHFNYNNVNITKQIKYMEEKQNMSLEFAIEELSKVWSKSLDTTINNRHSKAKKDEAPKSAKNVKYRKSAKYKPEQVTVKNSLTNKDYPKVEFTEQLSLLAELEDIPF